ncbi:MAG: class I SAM-dependent methyltransferase [Candidatus Thermoplasmatota archaeon]|jgi:ubiquinone/menaquinone biosynthesis C-methylase UbiE
MKRRPNPSVLPAGPHGRVLWQSAAPVPPGFAKLWDGDGPFDAVVLDDVRERNLAPADLQRLLAPGGLLAVLAPRRPRTTARRLRPYFEGGAPRGGRRFEPVRARHGAILAYRRGPALSLGHFDALAEDYASEIPPHLVQHYLDRKVAVLREALAGRAPRIGLDLGCGVGDYARAVAAALGCAMVAVDASRPAAAVAHRRGHQGVGFAAADAQRLPFADATFDFAYTINMVHHLKRGEQRAALAEALRVLKPGAPLVVFEINVLNPLFRFYMRVVFPRTRRIDRGDEEFLTPRAFRRMAPAAVESVAYSTFVPDFTPRWLLPALRPVERSLERVAGPLGIHYAAVLRGGGPQQAAKGTDQGPVA